MFWTKVAALAAAFSLAGAMQSEISAQEVAPPPAEQAPVIIDGISVVGAMRILPEVIEGEAGLQVGQELTFQGIQRAMARLWATGLFDDIRFSAQEVAGSPDRVHLTLEVEERPYVTAVDFRGLENLSASVVRDTSGLRGSGPYNPERAATAAHYIRSMLSQKGIRVRSVEHRLEPITSRPGEFRLVFDVDEGQRVAIAQVDFRGNEAFSTERLRKVLGTKQEGFFWFRSGAFDEDKLRLDLRESLPSFYGSEGYIDFAVVGDTLILDEESGKARLVIQIHEGDRYRVVSFDVRGNRRFPTSQLRGYFDRQRGGLLSSVGLSGGERLDPGTSIFDRTAFERATREVGQLYRNQGYIYSQIEPVVERTMTEDGEPAVRLAWEITEGNPAYVNRVAIVGNTRTHEDVIRERLLVVPGDVYAESAVIRSMENISGLGFFETPLGPPQIRPNDEGDIDITFEVSERQTGQLNFGTAIGGVSGVSGFLGYDEPNLFGQAKAGHLRWEFGRYSNNFEASYTDPGIADSRVSGSISLFNTSNRFFTFREGQFRRTGGGIRFGVPFPGDRWTRLTLGYSLQRTTYSQFGGQSTSLFTLPPGTQSSVTLGLTRSTMNHPLFPTSGTRHELIAELSGGPLGGHGDFQKYTAAGAWYVPVGQIGGNAPGERPVRFALGLSVEGGILMGDASRFPFDRFWMGGTQFGKPLRGYAENTITPGGYFPRGTPGIGLEDRFGDAFLRMSAEYAVRFSDNLSLSAFYDAGNVWREPAAIDPTRLFRGAGVGVTLVTPFGPLGLDYAYGFDRTQPGWQLHFKLGQGL